MTVFAVDAHLLWQVDLGLDRWPASAISALFSLVIVARRARERRAPRGPDRRRGGLRRRSPRSRSRSSPPGVVLGVQVMLTK